MDETEVSGLERARRLERSLVRIRWFGIALGLYLVWQTNQAPPPHASSTVLGISYAVLGAFALANLLIWWGARRARSETGVSRIGLGAFALDAVVIFAFAWIYTYDLKDSTWVLVYILPLEGAIRYRLEGSLAVVAATLFEEIGREAWLDHRFPQYRYLWSAVAFRVGVQALIALVAGLMARSLAQRAEEATRQAHQAEEAARLETSARRELAAFNTAILTGVAAEDLDTSLQLMAWAIGRDLGFESFAILLLEEGALRVKGTFGVARYEDPIPLGQGVTGTAAASGRPVSVPDVRQFPAYIEGDPEVRSEMAAPMRVGDQLIGVVDVQSRTLGAFDQASLDLLSRVADQVALVAHNNRLRAQQAETVQRLRELDQMKSDFVAITSHELRTPLTAIRGFVKTLLRSRERLTQDQVGTFLEVIDRQTARLARLVEDLLMVSRIEAGAVRLELRRADLRALLREAVEGMGPEARARVQVEADGREVRTDPDRLDQVVRNLLENALKFSPPGSPVLVQAAASDGWFEVTVTDRGRGIAEEDLPRIFDRFHQAGDALTRESEGAGLGLYITKRLVEAMGGEISVSTALGRGSSFRVRLPDGPPPPYPGAR